MQVPNKWGPASTSPACSTWKQSPGYCFCNDHNCSEEDVSIVSEEHKSWKSKREGYIKVLVIGPCHQEKHSRCQACSLISHLGSGGKQDVHVWEGGGTAALLLLSRSHTRSLVKDQWLGNYLTSTGALQMDCDSSDFRSLSDSQMHKFSRRRQRI